MTREELRGDVLREVIMGGTPRQLAGQVTDAIIALVVEACCAEIGIKEECDHLRSTFLPTENPDA